MSFADQAPLSISAARRVRIACGSQQLGLYSSQGITSLAADATLHLAGCDVRSADSAQQDDESATADAVPQLYAGAAGSLLVLEDSSVELPQQVRNLS